MAIARQVESGAITDPTHFQRELVDRAQFSNTVQGLVGTEDVMSYLTPEQQTELGEMYLEDDPTEWKARRTEDHAAEATQAQHDAIRDAQSEV